MNCNNNENNDSHNKTNSTIHVVTILYNMISPVKR